MSILRTIQGEKPGMGSELIVPDLGGELFATYSPALLVETTVRIADVSYYQRDINFSVLRSHVQGVIIRAGQRNWVDSQFKVNWANAKAAGLPRGSYWFYDSREDPKKQAALWWSLIEDDPGELVHVADLEESYGGDYWKTEHMRTFVQEFQRLSGLPDDRIAIYTGYFWWLARMGPDLFFKRFGLWLAWYADMAVIRIPAPWSQDELLFWQYTSSGDGLKYGANSLEIDLNWYCCSLTHYLNRFHLGSSEPENGETTMATYEGTAKPTSTPNVRVRRPAANGGLDVNGMVIDGIQPGQSFQGDAIAQDNMSRDWIHVTMIGGKPVDGWSAAWLLDYHESTPPPPPVSTFPDLPYTITLGEGSVYQAQTISGVLKPK